MLVLSQFFADHWKYFSNFSLKDVRIYSNAGWMYDKKQGVITGPQSLASPKFQQAKFVESLDVNEVHTESVEIPVEQ